MTLHQLKVFQRVVEFRSVTEAAKTLELRQPSVSQLIQSLERDLKIKLFERLGNRIRLTGAGERLLNHAGEILAMVDRIKEEMSEIIGLEKGTITIGGSSLAGSSFLLVTVQRFKQEFPGIEVLLKVEQSTVLEKMLLDGQIDVAVQGFSRSPLLDTEPFHEEEIVAIASPNHPLAEKASVSLELLAQEPLVTNKKGTFIRDLVERRFAEKGLLLRPVLEVDIQFTSRDLIRKAVANGLGIGYSTKYNIRDSVKAGRLKILKVPELNLKRTLYITIHKNRHRSCLVKAFINFLKESRGYPTISLLSRKISAAHTQ